ncbi:KpsF/GutQ family sugar-phosphate isomerase [Salinivibrio sp. ES.052]|uniref:KpsF/GutQ family sugar-phosphate isomerase n=1 Tax=Salinivibrio sp. ES.052 TaxID=1882823 RepID=UPI000929AA8C|nr:KpsF/GutQ family sugar-phosphate isomerase [Salinivibrio sp. ES.052]SIN87098.1 arabinose 5-phosphate isomerase [Salinivibrio sp. ES.052]
MTYTKKEVINIGKSVVKHELEQAMRLYSSISTSFVDAATSLLQCKGKVIISGVGKSGHIGKKIAATLASTGTPSFFVHPTEALHGDLGMIGEADVVIMISNSGSSNELQTMRTLIEVQKITTIVITSNLDSPLARKCDIKLDISTSEEACPLGLAPTSSTTNTLLLGDALALTIMTMRKFDQNDFALSHPAGALGSRLITRIVHLIEDKHQQAFCSPDTELQDAITIMCQTGLGLITIIDNSKHVLGVFTDGDLRRAFAKGCYHKTKMSLLVQRGPLVISSSRLCTEALALMHRHGVTAIPAVDNNSCFTGVINQHTIHRAGIC